MSGGLAGEAFWTACSLLPLSALGSLLPGGSAFSVRPGVAHPTVSQQAASTKRQQASAVQGAFRSLQEHARISEIRRTGEDITEELEA